MARGQLAAPPCNPRMFRPHDARKIISHAANVGLAPPRSSLRWADGVVAGTAVVCPLHAWKMSLATGEGLNSASASHCVETFPTRVEQGIIFLEFRADSGNEDENRTQEPTAQESTVICMDQGIAGANESCPAT